MNTTFALIETLTTDFIQIIDIEKVCCFFITNPENIYYNEFALSRDLNN